MALPSVAGVVNGLLGSPSPPVPKPGPNQSKLSLFWTNASGAIESIRFDVVTVENHERNMTVSDHPVELGANVVDHARLMPDMLTIEGFVSMKPVRSNEPSLLDEAPMVLDIPKPSTKPSLSGAVGALVDALLPAGPISATVQQASDFPDRVRDTYEKLLGAQTTRALVTAVNRLDEIPSMLITRVSVPRTVQDGTGANFHVELRRVRLVSAESVDAPDPKENRGKITTTNKGSQSKKEAPKAVGDSMLLRAGKGLGLQH